MIVKDGPNAAELADIVRRVSHESFRDNLTTNNLGQLSARRSTFTLRVLDSSGPGAHRAASGRRTVAACWHAHREVLRVLFDSYPDAVVSSALATYHGRIGFEHSHAGTYLHNFGSSMAPARYGTACDCPLAEREVALLLHARRPEVQQGPVRPPILTQSRDLSVSSDAQRVRLIPPVDSRYAAAEAEMDSWRDFVESLPKHTERGGPMSTPESVTLTVW